MPREESLERLSDRYLMHTWESLPAQIKQWVPEDRLRAELADSTAKIMDRVQDIGTATEFRAAAPVAGATPEDYLFKVIQIDRDKTLIAGMRFRQDPQFAFVEIYARDYLIESVHTMANTLDATRQAFAVFTPEYMRVHVATGRIEHQVIALTPGRTDFITVAGLISSLQVLAPPPRMERIHLAQAQSTKCYDRYVAEYKEFYQEVPQLKDLVPTAPLDTLEQCLAQGLLYETYVDGQWAGVIAAKEATDYGMKGYRVVEEILSSRFRGRGLGTVMQRHFIDKLPSTDNKVLHGAIDPANAPSLATAKRVGRVEVMHCRFVRL